MRYGKLLGVGNSGSQKVKCTVVEVKDVDREIVHQKSGHFGTNNVASRFFIQCHQENRLRSRKTLTTDSHHGCRLEPRATELRGDIVHDESIQSC
ncbi:hypothetical protein TNCV_4876271 [Trichonephila clavipes]|uniref:Uncharacterized protein n=1 Tax=Trichonephila clavipes TaxID=2585209 RepID=A0A8X6REV1_TRICX|nr:hypothetical protein TNCV_4876271 [Trichonephila clavipes]